jgi:two-component system, chemotaxis family, chemotaxis protein CheY
VKILIVDDNKNMREMIKSIIKANNEVVFFEAENGLDAIKIYNEVNPDWVTMDIRMDVMDGIEAAEKIINTSSGAKIIMVTDYGDSYLRKKAKEAGSIGYLLKENLLELKKIIYQ